MTIKTAGSKKVLAKAGTFFQLKEGKLVPEIEKRPLRFNDVLVINLDDLPEFTHLASINSLKPLYVTPNLTARHLENEFNLNTKKLSAFDAYQVEHAIVSINRYLEGGVLNLHDLAIDIIQNVNNAGFILYGLRKNLKANKILFENEKIKEKLITALVQLRDFVLKINSFYKEIDFNHSILEKGFRDSFLEEIDSYLYKTDSIYKSFIDEDFNVYKQKFVRDLAEIGLIFSVMVKQAESIDVQIKVENNIPSIYPPYFILPYEDCVKVSNIVKSNLTSLYAFTEDVSVKRLFINRTTKSNRLKYNNLDYGCNDSNVWYNYINKHKKSWDNVITPSNLAKNLEKSLNPFTYGIELETIDGFIDFTDLAKSQIVPLRDGSISGTEYASLPLSTAEDFERFIYFLNAAKNNKVTYDQTCSYHLHIGNFKITTNNVIKLLKVIIDLEDELYDLSPKFKRKTSEHTRRDYCSSIKQSILDFYKQGKVAITTDKKLHEALISVLTSNRTSSLSSLEKNDKGVYVHPVNNRKWHQEGRYKIVNFMNIYFSSAGTLEFRNHAGTFNTTKIFNWMLICSAIVRYAISNNGKELNSKSVTLKTVIDYSYSTSTAQYLLKYIEHRKAFYKSIDAVGTKEFINDKGILTPDFDYTF